MHYHLTQPERIELSLLLRLGYNQRQIAQEIGVHPSTICRELKRGQHPATGRYHARVARLHARTARLAANQRLRKLLGNAVLENLVARKLRLQWSPEQIAGWLRVHGARLRVCAQTIYDWLYQFRRDLLLHLRSQKQHYRRTRANTLRKQQRERLFARRRIDRRPASAERRSRYGHWEGDTMVSQQNSARFGTLVERRSGYLLSFRLANGNSRGFATAAARVLEAVPVRYLKTLTLDNGSEMQDYELLERLTSLHVFFAYPYHSWERGTNENTNGLLRQYFPKSSSLAVGQAQLDKAVRLLNTRPRKRLGYRTPAEVFETKW
jgi:transposase, IS30 family